MTTYQCDDCGEIFDIPEFIEPQDGWSCSCLEVCPFCYSEFIVSWEDE